MIRLTDDPTIPLTFETYYTFEKRNFDIVNINDDTELIDILCENPDVSAIVIQYRGQTPELKTIGTLPEYYRRRTFRLNAGGNWGIELALKMTELELGGGWGPTFSFVTPLYNTKMEYFKDTYNSLARQTVNDWEWVLVDDSPDALEYVKDFIKEVRDPRIRYYRVGPTNGNIGLSKWRGNSMSKGKWLIELDHDDLVMSWCLELLKGAIERYPENKFVYSDNTTIDGENNITPCRYGENYKWNLGYGFSYDSITPIQGKTIRTDSSGPINQSTIRHIVGVPNHFRCWEREFYFSIGGHNQQERIADDYELIVRSFLKTRFTHIRACCYAQRFDGQNSQYGSIIDSDGQGNIDDIQRRLRLAAIHYDKAIHERLEELGMDDSLWVEGDPFHTCKIYEKVHPIDTCDSEYDPFHNFCEPERRMKLGIFFLATSVYKNYFENFRKTLVNLFPDVNVEKHLIIMSDGLKEYDGKTIAGCKVHHFDVIDYPYPLVPMNKFQMTAKYMKDLDLDYGMFFDSDTIILKKPKEFWMDMKTKLLSGKLLCSGHPHYLFNPDYKCSDALIAERKDSAAWFDRNIVDEHRSYIITSFFAGSREAITKYADRIYKMIGQDLRNIRWMPQFVDECYMNKIYVDDTILGGGDDIIKEKFITITSYDKNGYPSRYSDNPTENNFPEYDTIFLNQKYDVTIKNMKKTNQV